jgi:branched-chain amino acid transport system substrate-binding protein
VKKIVVTLFIVTIVAAMILSGCAAPAPTPTPAPSPAPSPAPAPVPAKPIKIGLLYSLTGTVAQIGQNMVNSHKFAFEEINYEVAGRKIEIVIEDDAGKPETAIDKARKLVESDKVDLILGPLVTSCVEAATPVITKAGIPQLVGSPNDLKMGQNEWHIMVGGSKQQMVSPMGSYAYDKLGFKTVTVMTEDTVTGRTFLDAFLETFKSKGGKVVQEQYPPFGCPDFAPYLANLKDADACAAWFQGGDAVRFLIQYNEFGVRKRMPLQPAYFGAFVQPFLLNSIPPPAAGAMVGEHMLTLYTYLIDTPASKKFDAAWMKKTGNHPDDVNATPYMLTEVALKALEATKGDTTPAKLKQAILALDYESCEGRIRFDAKTQCSIKDTFICKIGKVDNKYVAIPVDAMRQVPPTGIK